jgi:hypothetical protein
MLTKAHLISNDSRKKDGRTFIYLYIARNQQWYRKLLNKSESNKSHMGIKIILFCVLLSGYNICQSQTFSRAHFKISDTKTSIVSVELFINNVIIEMDDNGNILSFNYLPGGTFDYWSPSSVNAGKLMSIGNITIDYWSPTSVNGNKLRSIGNLNIDYWSPTSVNGNKLRSIGDINFDYWSPTSDNANKLRSVGNIDIEYWSNSSDNHGRVRSVGNISIDYWSSTSINAGKLRSIDGNTQYVYATSQ